jgi:hypothetical protein
MSENSKGFFQDLLKEMFHGSIAGVVFCIFGHPFDTVKT